MTDEKTKAEIRLIPCSPVFDYEIKFVIINGRQDWAGLPRGARYTQSETGPGFLDCAITLPAYSAGDAILDFEIRARFAGWRLENLRLKSITPATPPEAGPENINP